MANRTGTSALNVAEIDTVLELLEAGIPLSLLLDLAMPLDSAAVYETESGSADWLYAVVA
jgi:hypothetical protein